MSQQTPPRKRLAVSAQRLWVGGYNGDSQLRIHYWGLVKISLVKSYDIIIPITIPNDWIV